jgi:hypothetical protein
VTNTTADASDGIEMPIYDGGFRWLDKAEITKLPDSRGYAFNIYREFWWVVNNKDQLLFWVSGTLLTPQANRNLVTVERHAHVQHNGALVEWVDTVFVPHHCKDHVRFNN